MKSMLSATLVFLGSCALVAQSTPAETTRAAFLKLIDRPRVALAPETRAVPSSEEALTQSHVTFAADAQDRVAAIVVKRANLTGRAPAVIFLHGTGGDKDQQLPRLKLLAGQGFVAIAIDARYHGERAGNVPGPASSAYSNAIFRTFQTGKEHPFFFDTVWDVMRTIDYLQTRADVDGGRVGLAGFSKGAIETYLAAAVDTRIAASVAGHGVQSFRWALEHNGWDSRAWTIRDAIQPAAAEAKANVGPPFLRQFYDRVAPGIYGDFDGPSMLPLSAPRPFLVVAGDSDPRTPMAGVRECAAAATKAFAAAGAPEKFSLKVEENVGHEQTRAFDQAMVDWFVRWLHPSRS
jgi:dienelactone hydrolase